jgi:hypothetical protein
MSLAAASGDLGWRCVYCYQASHKLDASVDKAVSALAKFDAGPNLRNIVLHVLGRPATTVSDKWKLRKREAKLSKEHQRLADHCLDIVLPAYHDEGRADPQQGSLTVRFSGAQSGLPPRRIWRTEESLDTGRHSPLLARESGLRV